MLLGLVFALAACSTPEDPASSTLAETVASAETRNVDTVRVETTDTLRRESEAPRPEPDTKQVPVPGRAAPVPSDGRFALIVSIGDYPGSDDDLPSAGPDADAIRDLLVDHYSFPPDQVRVLRDADATHAAIRRAFAEHLGRATDTAVFYFSGHGVRLGANSGRQDDEVDGRDEAIYVWADDGGGELVLDDEIGAWADALAARHVLAVLDACHSGTGARGSVGGIPAVKEVNYEDIAPTLRQRDVPTSEVSGGRRTILLAAAADREQAYAGLNGSPSLFTEMLTRALRETDAATPLADAMDIVARRVRVVSRNYGQPHTPQLEGDSGRTLEALFLQSD